MNMLTLAVATSGIDGTYHEPFQICGALGETTEVMMIPEPSTGRLLPFGRSAPRRRTLARLRTEGNHSKSSPSD